MRVTNLMMTNFVKQTNQAAKTSVMNAVQDISSGQAIRRLSDNPVDAVRIIEYSEVINRLDTFQDNLQVLQFDLGLIDNIMGQAVEILSNAKALALSTAGQSVSQQERNAAAVSARQYFEQLINLANTQVDEGRFLFGGTEDNKAPYDATVPGFYVGGDNTRKVEITPGVFTDATVTGADSFGATGEIFQPLQDFITALENGDLSAIDQSLDEFDASIRFTLLRQVELGERTNQVDDMGITNHDLRDRYLLQRAMLQEIDLTTKITELRAAETALDAIVQVTSRLLSTSLMSFLR